MCIHLAFRPPHQWLLDDCDFQQLRGVSVSMRGRRDLSPGDTRQICRAFRSFGADTSTDPAPCDLQARLLPLMWTPGSFPGKDGVRADSRFRSDASPVCVFACACLCMHV